MPHGHLDSVKVSNSRRVASTDYRHDKPKITYSLGCTNCMSRWRLEHGTLVERESELPYLAAKLSDESARKQLAYVALEVTRRYLSSLTRTYAS